MNPALRVALRRAVHQLLDDPLALRILGAHSAKGGRLSGHPGVEVRTACASVKCRTGARSNSTSTTSRTAGMA